MAPPAMVEIDAVCKQRSRADGCQVAILDRVDLQINPAEVIALIGPSGAGKSTFLRLLNRLDDVDAGEIRWFGQPHSSIDPLLLRRQVGLVAQKPFMFPGTVRENLMIPLADRKEPLPEGGELDELLAVCGAERDWLDQPARKLSVGQQQRVCLARALLNRPRLLLLDEPTSALDPETAGLVLERLTAMFRGSDAALLMVSHDHRLARRFADRILVLRDGRIVEENRGGRAEG